MIREVKLKYEVLIRVYGSEKDRRMEKLMGHTTCRRCLRCHHDIVRVKRARRGEDGDAQRMSARRP